MSGKLKNLASTRWNSFETGLLIELREEGYDAPAITKILSEKGVNRTQYAVQQRMCRLGLTKKPTGLVEIPKQRPFTPRDGETIRQFWHVLNIEDIAAMIGRAGRSGAQLTRKYGIEELGLPPYKNGVQHTFIAAGTVKRIEKMRDQGKNWNQIAEAVGLSPDLLSRRFRKDKSDELPPVTVVKTEVAYLIEPSNRPHPRLSRPVFFDNEPDIVNKMITGRPNGR